MEFGILCLVVLAIWEIGSRLSPKTETINLAEGVKLVIRRR